MIGLQAGFSLDELKRLIRALDRPSDILIPVGEWERLSEHVAEAGVRRDAMGVFFFVMGSRIRPKRGYRRASADLTVKPASPWSSYDSDSERRDSEVLDGAVQNQ